MNPGATSKLVHNGIGRDTLSYKFMKSESFIAVGSSNMKSGSYNKRCHSALEFCHASKFMVE